MVVPFVVGGGLAVTGTVAYTHRNLRRQESISAGSEPKSKLEAAARAQLRELRDQVSTWQHTEAGSHWEQLLGLVAVFACSIYVGETYIYDGVRCAEDTEQYRRVDCRSLSFGWQASELLVAILFIVDYFLQLLAAESMFFRLVSFESTVDLLSILPVLTVFLPATVSMRPEWGFVRLMRAVRILRLRRLLLRAAVESVQGQVVQLVFTILAIVFLSSAGIHSIAQFNNVSFDDSRSEEGTFWFHDAFYFVVATITTIGYGDIIPATAASRMLTVLAIVVTFALVPTQFQKLLGTLELQSASYNRSFVPQNRHHRRHVVIAGHLDANNCAAFLQELFHPDHFPRNKHMRAVLLTATEPSDDLKALVESTVYSGTTTCLKGSPLVERDLARACSHQAMAVFVLIDHRRILGGNSHLPEEPSEPHAIKAVTRFLGRRGLFHTRPSLPPGTGIVSTDEANLLRSMSVRAFIGDIPVITQVLQRDEVHYGGSAPVADTSGATVAIQRVKQSILAKSCHCPGFSTLVSNLVCSHSHTSLTPSDPATPLYMEEDAYEIHKHSWAPWEHEYWQGCSHEIYRVPLTPWLEQQSFTEAAAFIYMEFGAMLIGLDLNQTSGVAAALGKPSSVRLNPGPSYSIPPDTDGFLLCQSETVVSDILLWASQSALAGGEVFNVVMKSASESGFNPMRHTDAYAAEREAVYVRNVDTGCVHCLRSDGAFPAEPQAGGSSNGGGKDWAGKAPSLAAKGRGKKGVGVEGCTLGALAALLDNAQEAVREAMEHGGDDAGTAQASASREVESAFDALNAAYRHPTSGSCSSVGSEGWSGMAGMGTVGTAGRGGEGGGQGTQQPQQQQRVFWPSAEAAAAYFVTKESHVIVCADLRTALSFVMELRSKQEPHAHQEVVVVDERATEESALAVRRQRLMCCVHASISKAELSLLGSHRAAAVLVLARTAAESHQSSEHALVDAPVLRLCSEVCKSMVLNFMERHREQSKGEPAGQSHAEGDSGPVSTSLPHSDGGGDRVRGHHLRAHLARNWLPQQVLLELVYESNVRFCGFSGVGRRRADFFMSPAYAAGMVFVSSIMDRLTCQLFYNKDLLAILEALSQHRAYDTGGVEHHRHGHLLQISMMHLGRGYTYRQLVACLLQRGALVPVGLYRENGNGGAPLPYVVTNPPPDTVVTPADRIFVIAPPYLAEK